MQVDGVGPISGDVAWGGNWFFLVSEPGQTLDLANVETLTDFAWKIRQALAGQGITGANGAEIDHIELFGPPNNPAAHSRNFVLCPGKAYDRSPCGTGTSAKIACLIADGKLRPGQVWRQESIVGSSFEAWGTVDALTPNPLPGSEASMRSSPTFVARRSSPRKRRCCSMKTIHFNGASLMSTRDVAVLGAGIVGAACSRALAQAGLRVIVLDRAPFGSGATAAGMGHLVVMDDSDAQFTLTRFSQQLWDELAPRLPADAEYVKTGTLWVAADDEEMAAVRQKHDYYQARGVLTEILDGSAVAAAEPNLRPCHAGGLRVPGDSVVYPPCARWLIEEARRCGRNSPGCRRGSDRRRENHAGRWVVDFLRQRRSCDRRRGPASSCPTCRFGLARGISSSRIAIPASCGIRLSSWGISRAAHGSERASVAFNAQPRKTGQLLLGSSRQFDVEHKEVEPRMVERMIARALEYMPGLARLSALRVWTGFRAATPDSLPLIGPLPGRAGHVLATGHEGLGITTSLGTAALIACHLTGQTPPIVAAPYLPCRFSGGRTHG